MRSWQRLWYEKWNMEWLEERGELVRRQDVDTDAERKRKRTFG